MRTSTSWQSSVVRSDSASETTSDSSSLPEKPEFKRFIGRVRNGERGLELNPKKVLVKPGDSHSSPHPRTLEIYHSRSSASATPSE